MQLSVRLIAIQNRLKSPSLPVFTSADDLYSLEIRRGLSPVCLSLNRELLLSNHRSCRWRAWCHRVTTDISSDLKCRFAGIKKWKQYFFAAVRHGSRTWYLVQGFLLLNHNFRHTFSNEFNWIINLNEIPRLNYMQQRTSCAYLHWKLNFLVCWLTWGVENFLISVVVLGVGVEVPCEDRPVEPRRHQEAVLLTVFYVLHPVGVSSERSDFGLEISCIIQSYGRVVRAASEEPIVEKPVPLMKRLACCRISCKCLSDCV